MEEFVNIIKADIKCLTKALNSEPTDKKQIARLNPSSNNILSIDPYYVQYLLETYCSVDQVALFSGKRMELFKVLFLKDLSDFTISYIKGTHVGIIERTLILSLYNSLFTKTLLGNNDIDALIKESLDLWKKSLETHEMPVKFYVCLKGMLGNKTIEINDKCCIENIEYLYEIRENNVISNLSFYLYFSMDINLKIKYILHRDQEYFTKDYKEKWNEVTQWLLALYLSGYIFSYNEIEIFTPWWIWNPLESLYLPRDPWFIFKPLSGHDFEFFGTTSFKEKDISKIRNYYTLIKNSKILKKEEFSMILSRYFRMFGANSIQDMILDAFILLETIYTSKSRGEVTFRLTLNMALFLSSNKSEFGEIREFIKTFYEIRSNIAHGNEWLSLLSKRKYKRFFAEEIQENKGLMSIELFRTLKSFIDRSFLKIMCWELTHSKSFWQSIEEDILFFLNKRLFAKENS